MTKPLTARIEVFRPGTFTPMQGGSITYTAADLRAIADAYDPAIAPAPIVIGHPDADAPAFGWVDRFEYDANAERLFADLHEIEPSFAELVKDGRFKKVSMQFFGPAQGHNPLPGTWYPKHVGFLGAAAPAVSGLQPVQFSAGPAEATFIASFGDPGHTETATLFRQLRDFLIDRFGLDDADKALPAWHIEWLDDLGSAETATPGFTAPAADPATPPVPDPQKEPAVTKQPDPDHAAREAELTEREARITHHATDAPMPDIDINLFLFLGHSWAAVAVQAQARLFFDMRQNNHIRALPATGRAAAESPQPASADAHNLT